MTAPLPNDPDPPRKPGLARAPPARPRSRAARSAAVSLGGNGLQILIGLASTPILMRLLKPAEVGLMTMGLTLFAFVGSLSDFSLPHALVQRDRFDPKHAAGLFRLNRRLAVGLALLLAACGPLVALVYGRRVIIGISLAAAAVRVLLGPQWGGAVPLFRVLCLGAFATGLTAATKWVYLAEGLTGRQLRWTLVSTPAMIACVAGGAVIGKLNGGDAGAAFGTACGFSAGTLLLAVPTIAYCVRDSALTAADLWKPAWRPAAAAFLAAAILPLVDADLPANPLARLALSAALYGVTYAMEWLALPGGFAALRACRDVGKLLKK